MKKSLKKLRSRIKKKANYLDNKFSKYGPELDRISIFNYSIISDDGYAFYCDDKSNNNIIISDVSKLNTREKFPCLLKLLKKSKLKDIKKNCTIYKNPYSNKPFICFSVSPSSKFSIPFMLSCAIILYPEHKWRIVNRKEFDKIILNSV